MEKEKKISGEWIGYYVANKGLNEEKYGTYSPYFRKAFRAEQPIKKVELKIAALGWFKAYINGVEITKDEEFLGSWTDYNKRIEYVCYDITENIVKENAIGVVLGNGWACGSIVFGLAKTYYQVQTPCFVAEVVLTYADGSKESIVTDSSWKANVGEIIYNDIMHGEYVDARRSLGAFFAVDYDDKEWGFAQMRESRSALLVERKSSRTRVMERLPVRFLHTQKGADFYTTGQNITGILECTIRGKSGAKLVFRYGERLNDDGSVYIGNLRTAEVTDTYICAGTGKETFRPKFTFHGFEFIEICIEGKAEVEGISALAVYSDLDRTGNFSTSNGLVNKIYSNALWGQKSNFLNIPTDCPQRDERLGWLGDAGIFARSASWQMDCKQFFEHYLSLIVEAMDEDGGVPCLVPIPDGFLDNSIGSAAWSDALLSILSDHYDFYGDKSVVEKYFPYAEKFMVWLENNSVEYRRNAYCFSDWLSINANFKEGYGDVDFRLFDLCWYAMDCLWMQRFCEIIDKDATEYREKYIRAKTYFSERLSKDDKIFAQGRQTALMLAYKAGFLTLAQIEKPFVEDLEKNGMTSGFIGVKYLLPVLTELGHADLAYRLITNEEYPSWGYCIKNSATTIWERWDSYTKENGICSHGMNSFNHFAFGSCVEWFYEYVLGIKPLKAGFEEVRIAPYIDCEGVLTSAKGSYKTVFGTISVEWETDGKTAKLRVEVPQGIKYKIDVPCGRIHTKNGTETTWILR